MTSSEYRKLHPDKRNAERKRYYAKTSYSVNHNNPWTDEEVDIILKHEMTDMEISEKIGRSVQAIQLKRYNIKKKRAIIEQIIGGLQNEN